MVSNDFSRPFTTPEQRWQVLKARDEQADGTFFYGVTTTGIFCRPGCKSRLPRRENVRFFNSPAEAQAAGFRPCKRCRPDAPAAVDALAEAVLRACAILDAADPCPTLAELAGELGFSPYHFQRIFRQRVGVSPRQYYLEKRAGRVRTGLAESETVTEAIFQSGYGSSGEFYRQSGQILGMKPADWRNGGRGVQIRHAVAACELGWVLIAATPEGLCAIEFGDTPDALEARLRQRFPAAEVQPPDETFEAWVADVLRLLERPKTRLELPLDIRGTAFQRRVWQALREIPPGGTLSYAGVAQKIGRPTAARAVAQACAANPLAVAVPCHRVVRGDGALGGYRWGVERKRRLLEKEKE